MRDESAADLLPLFLRLGDKLALVVGGGAVAERKIASLLDVGARVRVVAPDASDEVKRLAREGRVEWRERAFEDADVEGEGVAPPALLVVGDVVARRVESPQSLASAGDLADELGEAIAHRRTVA